MNKMFIGIVGNIFIISVFSGCQHQPSEVQPAGLADRAETSYAIERDGLTDSSGSTPAADRSLHNQSGKPLCEIIGSTHTRPNYYFRATDSLNEGADRLLKMGSKVIKVWFYMGRETPDVMYPWNSEWPNVGSAVEGAKLPYWKTFFDKPFKTFILNTMEMVPYPDYYWRNGFTAEQEQEVERQMYQLACHFLTEYQGSGKTFIFSNHESDWHLKGITDWNAQTPEPVFENAIRWFGARQRGVERARAEVGMRDVAVMHAGEVVHVVQSMKEGRRNMVNVILPKVRFDLISYSCWDATIIGGVQDPGLLTEALDYITKNALESPFYSNRKHVFIGEFGLPENDYDAETALELTRNVVEKGLEWGCPYIVYWQLYCNEPRPGVTLPTWKDENSCGFWLIRPEHEKPTPVYDYFESLLKL